MLVSFSHSEAACFPHSVRSSYPGLERTPSSRREHYEGPDYFPSGGRADNGNGHGGGGGGGGRGSNNGVVGGGSSYVPSVASTTDRHFQESSPASAVDTNRIQVS